MHQDVKYDFVDDPTGISDRSVHKMTGLQFTLYSSEKSCRH